MKFHHSCPPWKRICGHRWRFPLLSLQEKIFPTPMVGLRVNKSVFRERDIFPIFDASLAKNFPYKIVYNPWCVQWVLALASGKYRWRSESRTFNDFNFCKRLLLLQHAAVQHQPSTWTLSKKYITHVGNCHSQGLCDPWVVFSFLENPRRNTSYDRY